MPWVTKKFIDPERSLRRRFLSARDLYKLPSTDRFNNVRAWIRMRIRRCYAKHFLTFRGEDGLVFSSIFITMALHREKQATPLLFAARQRKWGKLFGTFITEKHRRIPNFLRQVWMRKIVRKGTKLCFVGTSRKNEGKVRVKNDFDRLLVCQLSSRNYFTCFDY